MFTTDTTVDDVLSADLLNIDRSELKNLTKEVLCDVILKLAASAYYTAFRESQGQLSNTEPVNIQQEFAVLYDQIGKYDEKISSLIEKQNADIEEFLATKNKVIEDCEKLNQSNLHNLHNVDNKITINQECDPIVTQKDDFANSQLLTSLSEFCQNQKYVMENGHGVVMYGEDYVYGKNKPPVSSSIPEPINLLIKELQTEFPETIINQVLINKYEGSQAFLPMHSDNEKTIAPKSNILLCLWENQAK